MKTKTEKILSVMHVLTWVAFIGSMINAGAILSSYGVSCINNEASNYLYTDLNLYALKQIGFWPYTITVFSIILIAVLKAFLCYLLIKALSKISLVNPFTIEVALIVEKMSYFLAAIWLFAVATGNYANWLLHIESAQHSDEAADIFLFVAGLVFIISQIFKRGVEIQSENELTV